MGLVSSLRVVVLLSAAAAALAAAGRLWLSALRPAAAQIFVAQVEPDRSVWDRSASIRAAPRLSELLPPAHHAPRVRHVLHPAVRHHVHPAPAVRVSYRPATAPK